MRDPEERYAELNEELAWVDGWTAQVEEELGVLYADPELEDDTSDERFALLDNLLAGLAVWRRNVCDAIDVLFEPQGEERERDYYW